MTDDVEQPYAPPESDLNPEKGDHKGPLTIGTPITASWGRGAQWLTESFGYFKASTGSWVGTCLVGFVILMGLSMLPFSELFLPLITYCWVGGLIMGCKAQYDGEAFKLAYLFRGFQEHVGPLLALGVIMLIATTVAMLISFGSTTVDMLGLSETPPQVAYQKMLHSGGGLVVLLQFLVYLALTLPLTMLVWFAPALICLGNVTVFRAMQLSLKGCLKNIIPMLIYSLVLLIAMVLATIPLLLGWLVLIPMVYISAFLMFMDIFVEQD